MAEAKGKGKVLVVSFVALVLLGMAALIALIGLESGPVGNIFVPPGTTAENLPEASSPGAALVVRHCGHCHNLPSPKLHTAEQWPAVVARMRAQASAQIMNRAPIPTPEDERVLIQYLQTHAREQSAAR